jgi:hypothetical protein
MTDLQKYVAVPKVKGITAWADMTVDMQAWELAKVAMHGQNASVSAIAMRAQSIKEALQSGELEVVEFSPNEVFRHDSIESEESENEMERRTR